MKRIIFSLLAFSVMLLTYCGSSKKAQGPAKLTYEANIQPLIALNCSPCHIPPQGNKKAYVTFASVQGDLDEIVRRISLNPSDRGFMPFKHAKLPDSTINVFVQWKNDGMPEK